jgi:hypothetical protein
VGSPNVQLDNAKQVISQPLSLLGDLALGQASGGADASNYNAIAVNNSVFTINPAKLTQLTASKTYDGLSTVKAIEVTTIAGVPGETFTADSGTADISSKDVATANKFISSIANLQLGSVNGSLTSNYSLADADLPVQGANNSVTIGKAILTLQMRPQSKVYDGYAAASIAGGDVTATGVTVNGQTESVAFNALNGTYNDKNVLGANQVSTAVTPGDVNLLTAVNGLNLSNYTLSNQGLSFPVVGQASIIPARLTQLTASKTYDGLSMVKSSEVSTVAGVAGEMFTASGGTASISSKDVATANKTITSIGLLQLGSVNGSLTSNYDLSDGALPAAGVNSNRVAIGKAHLTQLTASKTYDGLNSVKASEVTTIAGVADEIFTADSGTADISSKDVATANKTITSIGNLQLGSVKGSLTSNYSLADADLPAQGVSSNSVAIGKAHLTQLAASKTYDGLSTVKASEVTTIVGLPGETFTADSGTADISSKDVATANKTITSIGHLQLGSVNGSLSSNYDLSDGALPAAGVNSNSVAIGKAVLTELSGGKVYDGVLSLTGAQLAVIQGVDGEVFTAATSDVVPIADKNVSAQGNRVTDVSRLHLVGSKPSSLADNYDLKSLPSVNVVKIAPKPISIAADAKSKVSGEVDPSLTWRLVDGSVLVSGDLLLGALDRTPGEGIGLYAVGQGTVANSNYAITYKPNTLAIVGAVGVNLSAAVANKSTHATNSMRLASLSQDEDEALMGADGPSRTVGAAVESDATDVASTESTQSAGLLSAELPDELRPYKRAGAMRSQVFVVRQGIAMPGKQGQLSAF